MGINYSIDPEAQIVRLEYVGDAALDDFTATLRAILRSVEYRPGFGFLVDRRNVAPPTREFIERVLAFMALQPRYLAGARWAVVASDATTYGMGRMGQEVSEARRVPLSIRPFHDIFEAEAWLRERPAGR